VNVTRGRRDGRSRSDQVVLTEALQQTIGSLHVKRAAFTVITVYSLFVSSVSLLNSLLQKQAVFIDSRGSKTLEGTKRTYMIFLRLEMFSYIQVEFIFLCQIHYSMKIRSF